MPLQETFSYEQEKAIQELEMRVKNCLTPAMRDDESVYYRFLKARDFDVNKAEKMLRKHITWRKVNQIDNMHEDFKPRECFRKYFEGSVVGYDKKGNIVVYSAGGKVDIVDILKCMTVRYTMKHWMWLVEEYIVQTNEENEKTGRNNFRATVIIDADKFPLAKATCRATIDMLLRMIKAFQDNYPERLKALYVINAPSYLVILHSIAKQIMSNALQRKVQIFGYSGWKEKLLEVIDADVLPAFLGGNRTDPDGDPMCRTFLNHGGRIPESYFVSVKDRCFKDAVDVKKIIVHPSEKEEIRVEVKEIVGSLLQWEFLVKGKDIGFGIFYEDPNGNVTDVIPIEKYETPDGTEKDSYRCRTTGNYVIVFDNSYSWMSSKEVQYCITVVPPDLLLLIIIHV